MDIERSKNYHEKDQRSDKRNRNERRSPCRQERDRKYSENGCRDDERDAKRSRKSRDEDRYSRQERDRKRSYSPKSKPNKHREERRYKENIPRRYSRESSSEERKPSIKRERDVDRSRPRDRNDYERNRNRNVDRKERSQSPMQKRQKFNNRKFNNRESENENYEWGKSTDKKEENEPPVEKEKPNFGLSGKLTEDTNKVNGVILKYSEPPEARRPKRRWRLYPFKHDKALDTIYIHRQSCFLIGRDKKVCEIAVDHPSCSKQHAALQYRYVNYERADGSTGKRVRPYIIDLDSSNGTFLNNNKIEPRKYHEIMEKDVLKFGFSSREYVLLHEDSQEDEEDDASDDNVQIKEEK